MMTMMTQLGSAMAGVMFIWATFSQCFPAEFGLHIRKHFHKLIIYLYPYLEITFHEHQEDTWYERSNAYVYIERYLSTHSSNDIKSLKANVFQDCKSVVLSMDDYEELTDEYKGIKVWWTSNKTIRKQPGFYLYYGDMEKRYYKLTCKRKDRAIITEDYMQHVLDEGKAIAAKTRQRKLYTNNKSKNDQQHNWSHIIFKHPSTFHTLAMDPKKKADILNDLITFSKSKDYYKKVGKSWKRGYLLYGPPGTGKSSMIAAMANLLEYDIYDLELTSVKGNTDLRKLLINTSSKSIIVIEDIDCSLDLTGQRKEKKRECKEEEKDPEKTEDKKKKGKSEVTLSGLLNFIDGLWSACGSERLIVFTTNYIENLDPALIRRGRMDKHIELSYCCYETFKVLARNYLDLESHELFATISRLLEETNMTPADVSENLMLKSAESNAESCLKNLIKSLENAKEEARLEAARIKVEDQARKKREENDEKANQLDKDYDKVQVTDTKKNDGVGP